MCRLPFSSVHLGMASIEVLEAGSGLCATLLAWLQQDLEVGWQIQYVALSQTGLWMEVRRWDIFRSILR